MTLKDLKRMMSQQSTHEDEKMQQLKRRLEGRPFYLWGIHKIPFKIKTPYCCFNHIIGLPKKDGKEFPLFNYESMLYRALMEPAYLNSSPSVNKRGDTLEDKREADKRMKAGSEYLHAFKLKHLWVKKATGLGVTEFMLRFMCWLCLRNDDYKDSQMVIVVAVKMIKRMKALFEPHNIFFDSKESILELNGYSIQAYPSNNLGSFRSLTNPKFILIEEADSFAKSEQEEVRHVAERYIAKSDPFICMVSTPYVPNGLFQRIEQEPFETCIYKKIFLDYTYGLLKIYSKEEIEKAKMSPSFPREYELQYQGLIGNVFSPQSIENCQKIEYDLTLLYQIAK